MPTPTRPARRSWLEATGQLWKLHLFFALMGAAVVLTVPILGFPGLSVALPVSPVAICLLQMACFAGAMLWLAGSMVCERCQGSFAWYFVTHGDLGSWLVRLRAAAECPRCGDEPDLASSQ